VGEEKRNVYGLLIGKPEEKRSLGRPGCRGVYNIKKDLAEIGWGAVLTALVCLRIGTSGELL
jgi:hypothetical protein